MCSCRRTAAQLCDGVQKPLPARASPFLSGTSVYMQRKESSKKMVNSSKVDVFLMGLGWSQEMSQKASPSSTSRKYEDGENLNLRRYCCYLAIKYKQ